MNVVNKHTYILTYNVFPYNLYVYCECIVKFKIIKKKV